MSIDGLRVIPPVAQQFHRFGAGAYEGPCVLQGYVVVVALHCEGDGCDEAERGDEQG